MIVIKAPNQLPDRNGDGTVDGSMFLAGSIGANDQLTELAYDWQSDLSRFLSEHTNISYVFNPRRDDWDSSWKQSMSDPKFKEQVVWELNALDAAEFIVLYFDPKTKAPISLLELGLHANQGKMSVICPDGYWRKGNVEVVCERYSIPLFNSIEDFKKKILEFKLRNKIVSSIVRERASNENK